MSHLPEILSVVWVRLPDAEGGRVFIHAQGRVDTDGWSGLRLRPRYSPVPPADGYWEFDFEGEAPVSPRLRLPLTVTAENLAPAPRWLRGIRVYAGTSRLDSDSSSEALAVEQAVQAHGLQSADLEHCGRYLLSCYYDHAVPLTQRGSEGAPRTRALRHELTLTISGRDPERIQRCLARLAGLGLLEAAAAVHARSGGGLFEAAAAILAHIRDELGSAYRAQIDDLGHWLEWRP